MDKSSISGEDGYNDNEYADLSLITNAHSFQQSTRIKNNASADKEFNQRVGEETAKLSAVERSIFKLVMDGLSISDAAVKLKISQQRASKCWSNIKEKLK